MALPFVDGPARAVAVTALIVFTLGYFAAADALYIARLAAYLAVLQDERLPKYVPPADVDLPRPRIALEV
jgi:hypothetical protein